MQESGIPRWVLFRSACYLGNNGISFGDSIIPHAAKAPAKSSINVDVIITPSVDVITQDVSLFADGKLDHVFIGPRLALTDAPQQILRDFTKKLAIGGHLVVCQKTLPVGDKVIVTGVPFVVRHQYTAADLDKLVGEVGHWRLKARYDREGFLLHIYKKLEGKKGIDPPKTPSNKPKACIARYGALGDMIIITPLIKQLAEDGYEVTMNISPYAAPIIANNPYVHNIAIQEREMIPNPELGEYWKEWSKDYDKYINLSESLEGRFLKVEGRRDFYTPKEWRIHTGEHNYYDYTLKAGGYPEAKGRRGELFFTNAEERQAAKFFSQHKGKFIVIWALNGSSHHKIYPSMELVCEDWLLAHQDSIIVTVGDNSGKAMEFAHQRLLPKCGQWSIRDSLLASKYANLVIGPETMMTNAAGCYDTPKITLLSHSTHEALCKYFVNDYCLAPDQELAPCYPCFQLHYTKESCPTKRLINRDTQEILAEAPACALDAISPQRLLARMEEVYSKHFKGQNLV